SMLSPAESIASLYPISCNSATNPNPARTPGWRRPARFYPLNGASSKVSEPLHAGLVAGQGDVDLVVGDVTGDENRRIAEVFFVEQQLCVGNVQHVGTVSRFERSSFASMRRG